MHMYIYIYVCLAWLLYLITRLLLMWAYAVDCTFILLSISSTNGFEASWAWFAYCMISVKLSQARERTVPCYLAAAGQKTFKDWCFVGTANISSDMVTCTSDTAAHIENYIITMSLPILLHYTPDVFPAVGCKFGHCILLWYLPLQY